MWNLDINENGESRTSNAETWCKRQGFSNKHPKFSVGQQISFMTGYHDHILATAKIKGIDGNDIYVYNDCYWFPIQDDQEREIKILERK